MQHFLKRNFSIIHGAGGKKNESEAPPPPVLNPPKLGALSSISSYSYSESVDALSEGSIDGIVNQNGQYLDGHRIFEGIYIDDVPVKKTIDPMDSSIDRSIVSLSQVIQNLTNSWFSGEEFKDLSLSKLPVQDFSYDPKFSVNNPYQAHKVSANSLSGEIIYGKKNIAKAISLGIELLKRTANDSSVSSEFSRIAKQKLLRYEAFSSFSSIENQLLKDYPLSFDYPLFCLKINLGNQYRTNEPLQAIEDISVGRSTSFYLETDVSNQLFEKLEISEIGKRRTIRPLRWIDTSYLNGGEDNLFLGGYIYLFGVHENGFPTKESLELIRKNVKNLHILDLTQEKYNYSNILAEIRNGDELQPPLGFFDRTYLDKVYGVKLMGPFSNQGYTLRVNNFKNPESSTGVLKDLAETSTIANSFISAKSITEDEKRLLETQWGLQGWLFKNGNSFEKTQKGIAQYRGYSKKTYTENGEDFTYTIKYKSGDLIDFEVIINKISNVFSYSANKYTKPGGSGFVGAIANKLIKKEPLKNESLKKFLSMSIILSSSAEGSQDVRSLKSYSNWSRSSISQFEEEPNSVVHVVRNPNVSSISLTMGIRALSDMAQTTRTLTGTTQEVDAGSKIPSAVRFKIEIGLQDSNGVEQLPSKSIVYQVVGLAESSALIDIGRVENASNIISYARFIKGTENIAHPLDLPEPVDGSLRYVKVTRTTYETYSSLIRREISLEKITEIINSKFSYPNTALVGVKLDSRTLSSLPPRSYDARLKRIMVPSNYYPLHSDGKDKRLYKTQASFTSALKSDTLIYDGNWDGTFKEAWSDNPAWIVFDLLTNTRYGMGNYISADQINIWELYKIGRFCDAVDEDGYFYGVPSAAGGLEPRYSCNIVIADKTNVFDAIKNLVSSFRGNIFYSNSYIDFTDDRVKLPNYFFNNQNVRDGLFNYTNSRRDQQYNTLEVSYFDRDDSFKVKTEYIEDPEDIKKRGVLRTDIDTFGVTSRAHANRIGKHIIYSTINENQAVSFICGPEILACRPGDLISVEDDLKSLQKNIGRILEIDTAQKILRLDEQFKSGDYLNEVSLFIPTGQKTYGDYYNMAVSPSKLAMNELYSNDVPQIATFKATGYQNLDYGCQLYLNQTGENIALLDKAKAGGIYSITLSGLKQEIYKLTSVRENSPIEYEVAAIKFDTGKFGSIESGQSLVDFYNNYPNVSAPTQGSETISQNNIYQLSYPTIQNFSTGNYDQQADSIDLSGSWNPVNGATHYDYELVTPKYSFLTGRTTGLSAIFTDQTQAGRFTLKVSARNVLSIPNPISPAYSSGITVLSYSAPVRTNTVFAGINIKNS